MPSIATALSGQVPGLLVSEMNGVPGKAVIKSSCGCQSSIGLRPGWANLPSNNPLIIVNDIPYAAGNDPLSLLASSAGNPNAAGAAAGGLNPLSFINMQDVESIEILKDADATAIYGSRGANGVIVITTRKGTAGALKTSADVFSGAGNCISTTPLLTTRQYVANAHTGADQRRTLHPMRKMLPTSCYGIPPAIPISEKLLVGGTSRIEGAHLSLTGGNNNIVYYFSSGIRRHNDRLSFRNPHTIHNGFLMPPSPSLPAISGSI